MLTLVKDGSDHAVTVGTAIIAGWTGRDASAVAKHIEELVELGVTPPPFTPVFYEVSPNRVTNAEQISVVGTESSGEVEFVLLAWAGDIWIGVGSDYTDRKVETLGIAFSKQICEKPVSKSYWRFADVRKHWDKLLMRSYAVRDGVRELYQSGSVAELLHPDDLILKAGGALPDGTILFGGTLAVIGDIRFAPAFEIELEDPVIGRSLRHSYQCHVLPADR